MSEKKSIFYGDLGIAFDSDKVVFSFMGRSYQTSFIEWEISNKSLNFGLISKEKKNTNLESLQLGLTTSGLCL